MPTWRKGAVTQGTFLDRSFVFPNVYPNNVSYLQYDNSPPMCKFITCGDLPNLSNGTFNLMNNSEGAPTPILGSVAVASCDLNFELSDESSNRIVCSERGHWEMMGNFGSRTPIWTTLIKCQCTNSEQDYQY